MCAMKPIDVRKTRGLPKPDIAMPVPVSLSEIPAGYPASLSDLKRRIADERVKAVFSANAALVLMYWDIGRFWQRYAGHPN